MNENYVILFSSSLTLIVSLLVFIVKVCFKSKCSDIDFCYGLLKIHRNTSEESQNVSSNKLEFPNRSTIQPSISNDLV